jgi:hypothetical protein
MQRFDNQRDDFGVLINAVVTQLIAAPLGNASANALSNIDAELFRRRL